MLNRSVLDLDTDIFFGKVAKIACFVVYCACDALSRAFVPKSGESPLFAVI